MSEQPQCPCVRRKAWSTVLSAFLVLILGGRAATLRAVAVNPSLGVQFVSFNDLNGNGKIDCSEPVTFRVFYTDLGDSTGAATGAGTVTLPNLQSIRWNFNTGGATTDLVFTANCVINEIQGFPSSSNQNGPTIFGYNCSANGINQRGVAAAVLVTGTYVSTTPGAITVDAKDVATDPNQTFTASVTQGNTNPCPPPDLALSKTTNTTTATPGATIVYTLAYQNLGGDATGVTLTDAVPANTTFSPGVSSAGWSCAPSNNAGSTCTLSLGNVAAGASGSKAFGVTVASSLPPRTPALGNTACANAPGNANSANNCSSVTTQTNQAPDLSIAKTAGSGSVAPGASLVYTLSYQNVGPADATGVTLTETVPSNTTFSPAGSSGGWTCSPNNNPGASCTFPIPSVLGGGGSGSNAFAVVVSNPLPAGVTSIENTGCVQAPGDTNAANNCSSVTTPTSGAPDLALTKTAGANSIAPGGTLTYTLAYQNVGNEGATGVTLQETVPANTTFNPGSSSAGWSCSPSNNSGSTCTIALGAVAASTSGSRTFAVTIVTPLPAGTTSVANTGCVEAPGDTNAANNCSTATTPTTGAPDLTVAKTANAGTVAPGATLTYTLSYQNVGNQGATGVVLQETVPANTTFNAGASSLGWSCSPNNSAGSTCTLSIGAVAGGVSGARSFAVTVANPLPAGVSSIGNTACSQTPGDTDTSNDCSTITTPSSGHPDLAVTKTAGSTSVASGSTLLYTLAYQNVGDQGATAVTLTDTVPANTTFNPGASSVGWACTPNNNAGSACTLSVGAVAAGASGNRIFAVTVANPIPNGVNSIANTACAQASGDPNPGNDCSSVSTPTAGSPDIALTKTAGAASVAPGDTVTYTLAYQNIGNAGASGVVLQETVPADTTFNPPAASPGWSCSPNNNAGSSCTLAVGAVAASASGSRTFAVTVGSPLPAGTTSIGNTACSQAAADLNSANDCSTVTTPATGSPNLSLTKTGAPSPVAPGGVLTYTLVVRNDGNQDASNVTLQETVPANATFGPGSSSAGWACSPDNNAGSNCALSIGTIPGGGGSSSKTFVVTVANPLPAGVASIGNTACAEVPTVAKASSSCSTITTPTTGHPDLSLAKTAESLTYSPGSSIVYHLAYTNLGDAPAQGANLTETVPTGTTFDPVGATAGWTCSPNNDAGSACTFPLPTIAPAAQGDVLYKVTVAKPVPPGVADILNTACAEAPGDSNSSNDCSSVATRPGAPVEDIPTLSTLGLMGLALALIVVALQRLFT